MTGGSSEEKTADKMNVDSALKSGPVPVLDPSGFEPETESVLFILEINGQQTGPNRTGQIRSHPVLRPVPIGLEPDPVPTGLNQLKPVVDT